MPANPLSRAAMLMVLLVLIVIGGWEIYLRTHGVRVSYDNGKELWADKRAMVYEPKATVFIGSSRIKFDLDVDTWEKTTGRHAVQLANEGSNPLPALVDLGNDPKFKGQLVVDITETIFFAPRRNADKILDYLAYYKNQTPAQKASFILNHGLESKLVFLDRDFHSLNAELENWKLPNRPGVFVLPTFPYEFRLTDFSRQNKMADRFLQDTNLPRRVSAVWTLYGKMAAKAPPQKTDPLPAILQSAVTAVKQIRSRGGEVIFIRTPSSGPLLMGEQHAFPRAKYWEQVLTATQSKGIYFSDNPATSHFICPEWSHLSPSDAILYTTALITELPPSFVQ